MRHNDQIVGFIKREGGGLCLSKLKGVVWSV